MLLNNAANIQPNLFQNMKQPKKSYFCKKKYFMRKTDAFRQYIWLVSTIKRYGKISLERLSKLWIDNDLNEGKPLSRTTFYRLKLAIDDMFGVCIECDAKDGFQYYISNPELLKNNSTQNWMLRTLTVNSLLLEALSIKDQILLEDIPAGVEHLETIITAIKSRQTLRMGYKKFSDSEPYATFIEPYCLKLFHQRWYLLGKSERRAGEFGIFALDRMTELTETERFFEMDSEFDSKTFFKDYFGIIPDKTVNVERIVLRAYPPMDNYLRTLPLHHSQKEITSEKSFALFEYQLAPTHDFVQAILKEGYELEVIEPKSLREKIQGELKKAIYHYGPYD